MPQPAGAGAGVWPVRRWWTEGGRGAGRISAATDMPALRLGMAPNAKHVYRARAVSVIAVSKSFGAVDIGMMPPWCG